MPEESSAAARSRTGRSIFISGLVLQASVLIGLAGTMRGLVDAFALLGTDGIGDPSRLSVAVGETLMPTFISLAGNFIGILLMWYALWRHRLRERWVFVWSVAIGIFLLPLSLPLLVFCLVKRHEFKAKQA